MEKLKNLSQIVLEKKNNWQLLSYETAKKLSPPVSVQDFNKFNEELLENLDKSKKRQREPEKKIITTSLEERILGLHNKLDHKIFSNTPSDERKKINYMSLVKRAEILNSYTIMHISPSNIRKYSVDDIISSFEKILNFELSHKLFNSTKLIKTIKLFKHCLEKKNDPDIKKLLSISGKLLRY